MGRRKLEIKRIEDKTARKIAFYKRRNGLLKKARELSVLCDVDVAVIIFSSGGNLYHYCSPNSLQEILKRYNRSLRAQMDLTVVSEVTVKEHELNLKYGGSDQVLEFVDKDLGEAFIDELSVDELVHLETQLVDALVRTRSHKGSV